MKKFSRNWKSSTKPRKQKKYRYNSPLDIRHKFVNVHLSKELRAKYKRRSIGLKKNDKVRIMRGEFKKHAGKVASIDLKKSKVLVEGVEITKKDGTKTTRAIDPSNLMIIELNIDDKIRQKILERKTK